MYKLIATLSNGVRFITNCPDSQILVRIAEGLGSINYEVIYGN